MSPRRDGPEIRSTPPSGRREVCLSDSRNPERSDNSAALGAFRAPGYVVESDAAELRRELVRLGLLVPAADRPVRGYWYDAPTLTLRHDVAEAKAIKSPGGPRPWEFGG